GWTPEGSQFGKTAPTVSTAKGPLWGRTQTAGSPLGKTCLSPLSKVGIVTRGRRKASRSWRRGDSLGVVVAERVVLAYHHPKPCVGRPILSDAQDPGRCRRGGYTAVR